MSEPRKFTLRQVGNRPNNYSGPLPEIDRKRAAAVLVRQSRTGADTAQAESRETQLGLQDYGRQLYGDEKPDVRLYDEGAGVSGQKRIDEREKLDLLYKDMNSGIVGTVVLSREDRLFRNKHMDQVGTFTKLAEEKRIKVIVPPISSASTDERSRVYNFSNYRDLIAFQDKMREAYGYIEGHVKHMLQCKQNKADKGGYDGRLLPPGLAVRGKKQNQTIVIYEPWAKEMRKLALRAQALDWRMGRLNREIEQMAYLFPEIPEEDREIYLIKTCVHHIPGVGYKPRSDQTIRDWFTNEMLIGWWQPNEDKPDTIIDNHPAVLDYDLFAEGYARIKGYTLEGEPMESYRGVPRIQSRRKTPPGLLFHGKLLLTPPSPHETAFICAYEQIYEQESTLNYLGYRRASGQILRKRWCCIPGIEFDAIVIERLLVLEKADIEMKDRVRTALEQVYNQQSEDFISIPRQLEGIQAQLVENAKKRLRTSTDDTLYPMLEEEKLALTERQQALEAKKDKLNMVDSPEEIAQLHTLLGNFEAVWPSFDLFQRQRAFSLLINRIEVEVVSPHWLRLSIDWLDAVCPRIDIAYIWKATPGRSGKLSDDEKAIMREHYPRTHYLDILKMMPNRTWQTIRGQMNVAGIRREVIAEPGVCVSMCYRDLMPRLDGQYLFRDLETTMEYIRKASDNTAKSDAPLYAFWILPETVEDLIGLVEGDFSRQACLSHAS
jgi:hypothetical protein